MIAPERETGNDDFRFARGYECAGGQRIPHDTIIHLGVEGIVVKRYARATCAPLCNSITEPLDDIRLSGAVRIA